MVPLVCELSNFEAQLLAARLGAEGMVWELRGGSSVYPVGWVDVLVASGDLERAQELLLSDEVEAAFDDGWSEERRDEWDEPRGQRAGFVFGATVVIVLSIFLFARLLSM